MKIAALLIYLSVLTNTPLTHQANISVMVKDLSTNKVIDSHRSEYVVPPASVMKLLTTGAALETLGADFMFSTYIEYTGEITPQGVLKGDLYIRGECDPTLGSKFSRAGFLAQWVQAVQKAGIKQISGRVIADMSVLDGDVVNPSWLWEDIGNYYAPGIFGINYKDNTLNIVMKSGEAGTLAQIVSTSPNSPDIQFNNHIRCTTTNEQGAYVHGLPYSNERYLTGSVRANAGTFGVMSDIPNPGLMLARDFQTTLNNAGITVALPASYITEIPVLMPPRHLIYTHHSMPLADILTITNTRSNNLFAESIFRYLGTLYSRPGTIFNSAEFICDFWRRRGVNIGGALIKDGCGLAPQNAISAEMLVQLLSYMDKGKEQAVWYNSLPVSGKSGTLRSLCAKTELEGRIHAKSGTIAGTKNFAGYIDLPDGRRWAFAVLVNSAPGKARKIQPIIEQYLLDVYRANK